MDLNKVYRLLEINSCGVKDVKELAEESGLTEHLVSSVLGGKKYRALSEEFKEDKAAGIKREYSVPTAVKLSGKEYMSTTDRYLNRLKNKGKTIDEIHSLLIIDDVEPQQATKMIEELEQILEEHKQLEMEFALDKIEEILQLPTKWAIVENDVIEVRPVPVLDGLQVVGVEYLENNAFYMPDELFKVYVSYKYQVYKFLKGDLDHDLTFTERANVSLANKFIAYKEKGFNNLMIANIFEIKQSKVATILGYITGNRSEIKDDFREKRTQTELLSSLAVTCE